MEEDEADAVMVSKKEHKLTVKAWELKIESLQRDRKSKVNKIKKCDCFNERAYAK